MEQIKEWRTKRLVIRPANARDAKAIFDYRSDAVTNKYQSWIPETIEDVDLFLEKLIPKINVVGTWFQVVIIVSENAQIIGDIGIHFIDEHQVEIGCTLAKDYQGMGYATESLKAVLDYLFGELDKHRVIASIDPMNEHSLRLFERLGFRKEAHFRESLLIKGKWVDDIIYALLKKEWE